MVCSNCGAVLADNTLFCTNCGATVNAAPVNQQGAYQQGGYQPPMSPARKFTTNRGLLKFILLTAITFGIYGLITYGGICDEVNTICTPHDGKKSMNFWLLVFIVGPLTCEIATIVWIHNLCNRIGAELNRRQLGMSFSAKDFWLWGVLGSLIIVGPFIYMNKFFKAMNAINENYNQFG